MVGVAQYLVDEPNADEYAGLATTVAKVRSQDPHALSFINLLPSNVSGYGMNNATGWAKEWGAEDYRSYVQELVDTVRPDIICFGASLPFPRRMAISAACVCRAWFVADSLFGAMFLSPWPDHYPTFGRAS